MSVGSSALIYRCAFIVAREAMIWDTKTYQKRQHAYNRVELLTEEKDYFSRYGRGQWEVMYVSGWKRDNNQKTVGISTVKWIEDEEPLEEDDERYYT